MRAAISSMHPWDYVIVGFIAGILLSWFILEVSQYLSRRRREKQRAEARRRLQQYRLRAKHSIRRRAEQSEKDQETLNKATEYRNDFSK